MAVLLAERRSEARCLIYVSDGKRRSGRGGIRASVAFWGSVMGLLGVDACGTFPASLPSAVARLVTMVHRDYSRRLFETRREGTL